MMQFAGSCRSTSPRPSLLGIIALLLLSSVNGCTDVAKEHDVVSTVDAVNVPEQYVVIHAGRDQGIKVGDLFTLSRQYYVRAQVVAFGVADTTCQARGYKGSTLEDVHAGDDALLVVPTVTDQIEFSVSCGVLICIALGALSIFWLGYTRTWGYAKKHNFWNSNFLPMSLAVLRVWFWLLFFSSGFFIVTTTYKALFVDGLYIQDLMLLYPFVGVVMLGTFGIAWACISVARRTP